MDRDTFFRTTAPDEWAGPPAKYSFSSLKKMAVCLREWQLARSRYGDLRAYPEPPSEPAVVGTIVHDLLSELFQAAALAGYPALGSEAFLAVMKQVNVLGSARERLTKFAESTATSLRATRQRPQATARDVYNHVAKAFREEYARVLIEAPRHLPIPSQPTGAPRHLGKRPQQTGSPAERFAALSQAGVLSEEEVRHPTLPLIGFIDLLVWRDGRTTILDFKTGAGRPEYHDQLLLYALMWWRSTGDQPAYVELRFGAQVEGWPVLESDLLDIEARVAKAIADTSRALTEGPTPATPGPHCGSCSYRQLCDDYWQGPARTNDPARSRVDRAIEVIATGAKNAFEAREQGGSEVTLVFDDEAGALWGPFAVGERLRVVGAVREVDGSALRITPSTEVFRCGAR